MTANPELSSDKNNHLAHDNNSLDRWFFFTFYACVGVLPAIIGLFDRRVGYLPLIIISTLIVIRMFMRPDCRTRMSQQVTTPCCVTLILCSGVLMIYALTGIAEDSDRMRLLGKPLTVLLATILLTFVWSHRDLIKNQLVIKGLFYAGIAGVLGVLFIVLWGHALNTFDFVSFLIPPGPISVYASNNELKILSILVFFAAAGLKPVRRMYAVSIVSIATIFLLSFFTIGIDFPAQGVVNLVHAHSEAIQFGIPLALLALILAYWLPKLMTHVVFGGTIFVLLTAPWIFQYWYRLVENYQLPRAKKFLVRGEIWDAVSIQALKAPFFGHGLDSTRYQNSVRFEQKYYMGEQVWHPHNMFLQIWLDMGLTGVAFVLAFLLFSWRATLSIPLAKRPAILAGVVMLITFALVTHSVWQTWSMALMTFVVVLGSLQTTSDAEKVRTEL